MEFHKFDQRGQFCHLWTYLFTDTKKHVSGKKKCPCIKHKDVLNHTVDQSLKEFTMVNHLRGGGPYSW